ncbi:MAG: hypothetical protein P1V19_05165 [Gimesia sp.]|nr:hypothetical protein [Gimesia sp.]
MCVPDNTQSRVEKTLSRFFAQYLALLLALFLYLPDIGAQTPLPADPFDAKVSEEYSLVQQALDGDDYDSANRHLSEMHLFALNSKNRLLLKEIQGVKKRVKLLEIEFGKVRKYSETLKKNPEDSQANEQMGIFCCAVKGNWGAGLKRLAKADNDLLKETVLADLKRPANVAERLKLVDDWWKLAKEAKEPFRKACQLRGRYWYLQTRSEIARLERLKRDIQLQQIPLRPDKIIIWNQHNGHHANSGTSACTVTLFYKGKSVWSQAVQVPWQASAAAKQTLQPPNVRCDQIRVDITKYHGYAGGLAEVEVFEGNINLAKHCAVAGSGYWNKDRRFVPSHINNGITTGDRCYWLLNKQSIGWIAISMLNQQ